MIYAIFGLLIMALKLPLYSIVIIYLFVLLLCPSGQRRFLLYGLLLAVVIVDVQAAFLHYNDGALPSTASGYVYRIADGKADIYIDGQKYRLKAKGLTETYEGQYITLQDAVFYQQKTLNQASYNFQRHYQLLGYRGYLKARSIVRSKAPPDYIIRRLSYLLRGRLLDFFDQLSGRAAVLGRALLLGEISDHKLLEQVKDLGLLHLFVISGYHFTVITVLALFIMHRLLRLHYRWSLVGVIIISLIYLTIVKLGFGSLRACLAVILSSLCFLTKRQADGVQIALIYVFIALSLNIAIIYDLGFQLTVLTYIAVVVTGRWLQRHQIAAPTLQALLLSAVVMATISGVLIYSQGSMPVSGILLIPLLTPLVGGFIILTIIGLLLSGLGALYYLSWPINFLADRIYDFINWSTDLTQLILQFSPFIALSCVVILLAVFVSHFLSNRAWRLSSGLALGLLIAAVLLFKQVNFGLIINGYALYDGEAYLIRAPNAVVLYDVGNSPEIVHILRRSGVSQIDAIIISHAHQDHDGMLETICRQFSVKQVIAEIETEKQLEIGALNLHLYRAPATLSDNLNDQSIACHLHYGRFDMLLTGDMETASTKWLVEKVGSLPVEILKVPHHGSYNDYFSALVSVCQPQAAVIAGGNGKRINKTKVLKILDDSKTPCYDAMTMGEITIKVDDSHFTIDVINGAALSDLLQ